MLAPNAYSLRKQPSQVRKQLAQRLQRVRKAAGLTQDELADRADVSLGSLRRFETTGKVSLENYARLAEGIGRLKELERLCQIDEDLERARLLFSK